jgi:Domain of unknown function (DUF4390)
MSRMSRRVLLQRSASLLLGATLAQAAACAHAEGPARNGAELARLSVRRGEEGLLVSYDIRFDVPRDLEYAMSKGVAVVFEAEAVLFKKRWYWLDDSVARSRRRWRLAYQPLTRQWRLSQTGFSRSYNTLADALDAIRRIDGWRIADNVPAGEEADHYVDFSFKLDTDELPRPILIGLDGQSDWRLAVDKQVSLPRNR